MTATDPLALVDIVEIDTMTGYERTMWMHIGVTAESAAKNIAWKRQHISGRYAYRIVPTGTGPKER